jgi:hypothetical protein
VALALLVVMAGVFGVNLVAGTARYVDTFRTYDQLTFSVDEFSYNGPREPIDVALRITNHSDHDIDVLVIEIALRAAGVAIGGGQARPNITVPAGESVVVPFTAQISFPAQLEELGPDPTVEWLATGRIRVRLNPELDTTWVAFRFERVT